MNRQQPSSSSARPAIGPRTALAAVALPLAAVTLLPASAGAAVAPGQIAGDGFSAAGPDRGDGKREGVAVRPGKRVGTSGDGLLRPLVTGSQALVGNGVEFFANDAITFSTTSSASGALSEASMTTARHDVSTLDGGVTSETLNDAFDGYNSLAVQVGDNVPEYDEATFESVYKPTATWYNKNGAGALTCGTREVSLNPQMIGDLRVTRRVWVPADRPIARHLNIVTNTGTTPQTVTLGIHNNLGSDSNTRITGSASGDTTVTSADGWYGSMQRFWGTTSSDPRLGFVLGSPGNNRLHAVERAVDGDDNPYWSYRLTIQPGETRIIANFVVVEANVALANGTAAALSANPLTDCMSDEEIAQLANFDVTPPELDLPPEVRATATSDQGASVSFTATATDPGNGSVPVSCSPASGSLFPVGTTSVTCTAVDTSGNTISGSFPVIVAAAPVPAAPEPAAPAPAAPVPPAAAPRVCTSRRQFTVTVDRYVKQRDRKRIRRASATIDGKRVAVRKHKGRYTVNVDLRGRPRGEVRLRVKFALEGGRTADYRAVYRPCTPRKAA